jgi:hypothetical protein
MNRLPPDDGAGAPDTADCEDKGRLRAVDNQASRSPLSPGGHPPGEVETGPENPPAGPSTACPPSVRSVDNSGDIVQEDSDLLDPIERAYEAAAGPKLPSNTAAAQGHHRRARRPDRAFSRSPPAAVRRPTAPPSQAASKHALHARRWWVPERICPLSGRVLARKLAEASNNQ